MGSGPYQPPLYNNYQQPYQPGQFIPPQPPQKRRSPWQWYRSKGRFTKLGLGCGSLILLLVLCTCSLAAYGSTLPPQKTAQPTPNTNNALGQTVSTATTDATSTDQPTLSPSPTATATDMPTPTPSPTPTPKPTPTSSPQGPDLQTVKTMIYNATYSQSAKVDFYSQKDAVLKVSDTLGTEVCCDNAKVAAQEDIRRIEKAFYTSNVYMSSVTVTVIGTIRDQNGNAQGTGPLAKVTLIRSTASTIDWTFATYDGIWESYDQKWLAPSLNY